MKQMVRILICLALFSSTTVLATAQGLDAESFTRKGRVLVETGVGLGGVSFIGESSGLNLILISGEFGAIASADIGYFITEEFALKGQFSTSLVGFWNLFGAGLSGKYYVYPNIFLEAGSRFGFGAGSGIQFLPSVRFGGAFELARNVLLELSIRGLYSVSLSQFALNFGLGFALIL